MTSPRLHSIRLRIDLEDRRRGLSLKKHHLRAESLTIGLNRIGLVRIAVDAGGNKKSSAAEKDVGVRIGMTTLGMVHPQAVGDGTAIKEAKAVVEAVAWAARVAVVEVDGDCRLGVAGPSRAPGLYDLNGSYHDSRRVCLQVLIVQTEPLQQRDGRQRKPIPVVIMPRFECAEVEKSPLCR